MAIAQSAIAILFLVQWLLMNYWQSPTIRLRAVEPEDAETFYRWNLDSSRGRYLDFVWPPTSLAMMRTWSEEKAQKRMEADTFHWVIETLDGVPVGSIDTHGCDPHAGVFSYGVDIDCEQRGRGYAGEAIKLVLRYYFDQLRYQKVTVPVHSDNLASRRLHEKLGYQLEGKLRRTIFQNGQYLDTLYYGLTVEEFYARYGHSH